MRLPVEREHHLRRDRGVELFYLHWRLQFVCHSIEFEVRTICGRGRKRFGHTLAQAQPSTGPSKLITAFSSPAEF